MPSKPARIDRIEENLDRLTTAVGALAASVAAHDTQIEQLLTIAEENRNNWKQLHREWRAYLRTIQPQ